ncbi:hypothetical protein D9M69_510670 [compost metagenome]
MCVVVLVNYKKGHEAATGIRHGDRNRSRIQIEHGGRIKSVPVQANDCLLVERRHFPCMVELSKATVRGDAGEVKVALGSHKVVAVDHDRFGCSRMTGEQRRDGDR